MTTLTTPLDAARHRPPAPILKLPVRLTAGGAQIEVEFFIDTGADFTCLPASAVAASPARRPGPDKRFRRGDGTIGILPTVWAEVDLLGRVYDGQYAVTNDGLGLLGREILQEVAFTFDGPAGTLTVAG